MTVPQVLGALAASNDVVVRRVVPRRRELDEYAAGPAPGIFEVNDLPAEPALITIALPDLSHQGLVPEVF